MHPMVAAGKSAPHLRRGVHSARQTWVMTNALLSAALLSASLRSEYPADLVAAALTQQALRVAGQAKFSRADQMLFTRAGLEQASSELTARHAATRFASAGVV